MDAQPNQHIIEKNRYENWLRGNVFAPVLSDEKETHAIMMPPPNVTGSLHMGHALNLTLQDTMCRYWRMQGKNVLWQPGVDHAGIATQMVVERSLEKQGLKRKDMTREEFISKVWEWKEKSGQQIVHQQKRLGITADWHRSRFTMDDGLSKAVRDVFVRLHEEGLIYQDEKLVNWDPKFQTAISDLEVENETRKGSFWFFRYPLVEHPNKHVIIATTRPETLLGDVALAVHPKDERYKNLVGQEVFLPLTNRTIPIVADAYCDPEKGTGAVKITPAHDFNDFEVGIRHQLPRINVMNETAHMAGEHVPAAYQGLSREEARKKIVADMDAKGLIEKIEEIDVTFPIGERSGTVVEPRLTKQWFAHMAPLAQKALEAVAQGETTFTPQNWTKVYNDWLENIQPWCISRQLWWGHQLPIWYGPDEVPFVATSLEKAREKARLHYKKDVHLTQDPDVMDTWFSSALWPFSTLGWPEKTKELELFYPTTTLVTGFDIIFFWVARMMMMGLHFTGKVPFKSVYIHALILDEKGQKMSKSKGNVIDPLELMDAYGADNLRFALASQATPGRDVRFSEAQVESARNFTTKIWNASRFYLNIREGVTTPQRPEAPQHFINQWLLAACDELVEDVTKQMDKFRYDLAFQSVYQFAWTRFCDWYLELTKPLMNGDDLSCKAECQHVMGFVLQTILKLLHPAMPFITEEIWSALFGETLLLNQDWPTTISQTQAAPAEAKLLIELISSLRTARGEVNAPPSAKVPLYTTEETKALEVFLPFLSHLGRVSDIKQITTEDFENKAMLQVVVAGKTYGIPLEGLIDIKAEEARLNKLLVKSEKEIQALEKKMNNKKFVENAPPAVIEKNQQRLAEEKAFKEKSQEALARMR